MNLFQTIITTVKAVSQWFGAGKDSRPGAPKFNPAPSPKRFLRARFDRVKGPAFIPESEGPSRQTRRAFLRAKAFQWCSVVYPLATRRQRRRVSRLIADANYRQLYNARGPA